MTVTISAMMQHEAGEEHLLLHGQREVAAGDRLHAHDGHVAAVEHGNRQQVQQARGSG